MSFNFFNSIMSLKPGDSVLDIGCGTGLISKQYTDREIKYIGIDSDHSRIERAKMLNPRGQFIVGDLRDPAVLANAQIQNVILHGVIHHLSDVETAELFTLLRSRGCRFVGTMDPVLPVHCAKKPVATLLCKLDQGNYVRTADNLKIVIHKNSLNSQFFSYKTIRWPVEIYYSVSRLVP